jgi:hypothetical protein
MTGANRRVSVGRDRLSAILRGLSTLQSPDHPGSEENSMSTTEENLASSVAKRTNRCCLRCRKLRVFDDGMDMQWLPANHASTSILASPRPRHRMVSAQPPRRLGLRIVTSVGRSWAQIDECHQYPSRNIAVGDGELRLRHGPRRLSSPRLSRIRWRTEARCIRIAPTLSPPQRPILRNVSGLEVRAGTRLPCSSSSGGRIPAT